MLDHIWLMLDHIRLMLDHIRLMLDHIWLMLDHIRLMLDHIRLMLDHIPLMLDHIRRMLYRFCAVLSTDRSEPKRKEPFSYRMRSIWQWPRCKFSEGFDPPFTTGPLNLWPPATFSPTKTGPSVTWSLFSCEMPSSMPVLDLAKVGYGFLASCLAVGLGRWSLVQWLLAMAVQVAGGQWLLSHVVLRWLR
jgi:hypothetical protein